MMMTMAGAAMVCICERQCRYAGGKVEGDLCI